MMLSNTIGGHLWLNHPLSQTAFSTLGFTYFLPVAKLLSGRARIGVCALSTSSPVLSDQSIGKAFPNLWFCHFNMKFGFGYLSFPLEILESITELALLHALFCSHQIIIYNFPSLLQSNMGVE